MELLNVQMDAEYVLNIIYKLYNIEIIDTVWPLKLEKLFEILLVSDTILLSLKIFCQSKKEEWKIVMFIKPNQHRNYKLFVYFHITNWTQNTCQVKMFMDILTNLVGMN